jgi:hypothetical protein
MLTDKQMVDDATNSIKVATVRWRGAKILSVTFLHEMTIDRAVDTMAELGERFGFIADFIEACGASNFIPFRLNNGKWSIER